MGLETLTDPRCMHAYKKVGALGMRTPTAITNFLFIEVRNGCNVKCRPCNLLQHRIKEGKRRRDIIAISLPGIMAAGSEATNS